MSWDEIVDAFKASSTPEFEGVEQVQDHKQGTRTVGYAAADSKGHLEPHVFTRRTPGADDIHIQVGVVFCFLSLCCLQGPPAAALQSSCAAPCPTNAHIQVSSHQYGV